MAITNEMLYNKLEKIEVKTEENTKQITLFLGEAKQRPVEVCRNYVNKKFVTIFATFSTSAGVIFGIIKIWG